MYTYPRPPFSMSQQVLYIALLCLSIIWVLRQGTGWQPPIAGRKIQMGPQRQNLTNLHPVFCKKWVFIWIRGKAFFFGAQNHFFGRQNWPFLRASSLFRNWGPFSRIEGSSRNSPLHYPPGGTSGWLSEYWLRLIKADDGYDDFL